jgi:hypothetical protein
VLVHEHAAVIITGQWNSVGISGRSREVVGGVAKCFAGSVPSIHVDQTVAVVRSMFDINASACPSETVGLSPGQTHSSCDRGQLSTV